MKRPPRIEGKKPPPPPPPSAPPPPSTPSTPPTPPTSRHIARPPRIEGKKPPPAAPLPAPPIVGPPATPIEIILLTKGGEAAKAAGLMYKTRTGQDLSFKPIEPTTKIMGPPISAVTIKPTTFPTKQEITQRLKEHGVAGIMPSPLDTFVKPTTVPIGTMGPLAPGVTYAKRTIPTDAPPTEVPPTEPTFVERAPVSGPPKFPTVFPGLEALGSSNVQLITSTIKSAPKVYTPERATDWAVDKLISEGKLPTYYKDFSTKDIFESEKEISAAKWETAQVTTVPTTHTEHTSQVRSLEKSMGETTNPTIKDIFKKQIDATKKQYDTTSAQMEIEMHGVPTMGPVAPGVELGGLKHDIKRFTTIFEDPSTPDAKKSEMVGAIGWSLNEYNRMANYTGQPALKLSSSVEKRVWDFVDDSEAAGQVGIKEQDWNSIVDMYKQINDPSAGGTKWSFDEGKTYVGRKEAINLLKITFDNVDANGISYKGRTFTPGVDSYDSMLDYVTGRNTSISSQFLTNVEPTSWNYVTNVSVPFNAQSKASYAKLANDFSKNRISSFEFNKAVNNLVIDNQVNAYGFMGGSYTGVPGRFTDLGLSGQYRNIMYQLNSGQINTDAANDKLANIVNDKLTGSSISKTQAESWVKRYNTFENPKIADYEANYKKYSHWAKGNQYDALTNRSMEERGKKWMANNPLTPNQYNQSLIDSEEDEVQWSVVKADEPALYVVRENGNIRVALDPLKYGREEWKTLSPIEKVGKTLFVGATQFPKAWYAAPSLIMGEPGGLQKELATAEYTAARRLKTEGFGAFLGNDVLQSPAVTDVILPLAGGAVIGKGIQILGKAGTAATAYGTKLTAAGRTVAGQLIAGAGELAPRLPWIYGAHMGTQISLDLATTAGLQTMVAAGSSVEDIQKQFPGLSKKRINALLATPISEKLLRTGTTIGLMAFGASAAGRAPLKISGKAIAAPKRISIDVAKRTLEPLYKDPKGKFTIKGQRYSLKPIKGVKPSPDLYASRKFMFEKVTPGGKLRPTVKYGRPKLAELKQSLAEVEVQVGVKEYTRPLTSEEKALQKAIKIKYRKASLDLHPDKTIGQSDKVIAQKTTQWRQFQQEWEAVKNLGTVKEPIMEPLAIKHLQLKYGIITPKAAAKLEFVKIPRTMLGGLRGIPKTIKFTTKGKPIYEPTPVEIRPDITPFKPAYRPYISKPGVRPPKPVTPFKPLPTTPGVVGKFDIDALLMKKLTLPTTPKIQTTIPGYEVPTLTLKDLGIKIPTESPIQPTTQLTLQQYGLTHKMSKTYFDNIKKLNAEKEAIKAADDAEQAKLTQRKLTKTQETIIKQIQKQESKGGVQVITTESPLAKAMLRIAAMKTKAGIPSFAEAFRIPKILKPKPIRRVTEISAKLGRVTPTAAEVEAGIYPVGEPIPGRVEEIMIGKKEVFVRPRKPVVTIAEKRPPGEPVRFKEVRPKGEIEVGTEQYLKELKTLRKRFPNLTDAEIQDIILKPTELPHLKTARLRFTQPDISRITQVREDISLLKYKGERTKLQKQLTTVQTKINKALTEDKRLQGLAQLHADGKPGGITRERFRELVDPVHAEWDKLRVQESAIERQLSAIEPRPTRPIVRKGRFIEQIRGEKPTISPFLKVDLTRAPGFPKISKPLKEVAEQYRPPLAKERIEALPSFIKEEIPTRAILREGRYIEDPRLEAKLAKLSPSMRATAIRDIRGPPERILSTSPKIRAYLEKTLPEYAQKVRIAKEIKISKRADVRLRGRGFVTSPELGARLEKMLIAREARIAQELKTQPSEVTKAELEFNKLEAKIQKEMIESKFISKRKLGIPTKTRAVADVTITDIGKSKIGTTVVSKENLSYRFTNPYTNQIDYIKSWGPLETLKTIPTMPDGTMPKTPFKKLFTVGQILKGQETTLPLVNNLLDSTMDELIVLGRKIPAKYAKTKLRNYPVSLNVGTDAFDLTTGFIKSIQPGAKPQPIVAFGVVSDIDPKVFAISKLTKADAEFLMQSARNKIKYDQDLANYDRFSDLAKGIKDKTDIKAIKEYFTDASKPGALQPLDIATVARQKVLGQYERPPKAAVRIEGAKLPTYYKTWSELSGAKGEPITGVTRRGYAAMVSRTRPKEYPATGPPEEIWYGAIREPGKTTFARVRQKVATGKELGDEALRLQQRLVSRFKPSPVTITEEDIVKFDIKRILEKPKAAPPPAEAPPRPTTAQLIAEARFMPSPKITEPPHVQAITAQKGDDLIIKTKTVFVPRQIQGPRAIQEYIQTQTGRIGEVAVNRMISRQMEDQIHMGKQLNKQTAREISKIITENITENITRTIPITIPKHIVKQINQQINKQINKQLNKQIQRQIQRQLSKQIPKIIPTPISKPIPTPIFTPAVRLRKIEAYPRRPRAHKPPATIVPFPPPKPRKRKKDHKRRVSPFGTRYKEREFALPTFIGALKQR